MMAIDDGAVVAQLLCAIEQRDLERVMRLCHPDVSFQWPPGLPYSGTFTGDAVAAMRERFMSAWRSLQPTAETRCLDATIVATGSDGHVIARYRWRALDRAGERLDAEVLADYQVRDGRVVHAQMFYFDLPTVAAFLERARRGGA